MADLTATLFLRYNRIMRGTFVGVLLVACALVYLQFQRTLDAETASLTQRMQEQGVALDAILKSSTDAVNSMRIHAQTWYILHPDPQPPSPLRQALRPCHSPGGVCLDNPPLPWTFDQIGNLTGFPGPPTPALNQDLEMALSLNDVFLTIKANIPEAAWVYYTSAQRFINIYPWIASKDFFYADTLKKKTFFQGVEPAQDPSRRIIWTPAYLDEAGQGVMVTASAGVFQNGQFRGAVSLDLTLVRLNQFVRNWHSQFGTLFIINDRGQLLAHPTLVQPGGSEVLPVSAAFPPSMAANLNATLTNSSDHFLLTHGYYVEALGIQNAPFRLVLIVPRWALVVSALQAGVLSVLLLVIGLTVMLLVASQLTQRDAITPAQKLVRYIHDENLGSVKTIPDVPQAWRPWFQTIQNVFNAHTQLVSIQQELDVARRMQQSILPKRFPTRPDLQMFARMIPAKEVGGDFYDYFWLSDTKVGVVIADVSGKGVPAALFMAVARTLLRAIAPATTGPGTCLALANDLLSQDNDAMMFVTLFYGILDTSTGELAYANAGHNPPYLIAPDGTISQLPGTGGMALGVMENMPYAEAYARLEPHSTLLLYTDGITEAFNPEDEEFGEARLATQLVGLAHEPVEPLLMRLIDSVYAFANGAPQSDDITCLAIHYSAVDAA